MPMFQVPFQPGTNESFWCCDHMCLAPSVINGVPVVMHGVLSHSSAQSGFDYMTSHNLKPKVIEDAGQVIELNVSLPECGGKKMV